MPDTTFSLHSPNAASCCASGHCSLLEHIPTAEEFTFFTALKH